MRKRTRVYREYIDGPEWAARREAYYETHSKVCAECGITKKVQLHHKTYVRLGSELDSDLVPLCSKHHRQAHADKRAKRLRDGPRARGVNPRALGVNPKAAGTNPRATGSNPRRAVLT